MQTLETIPHHRYNTSVEESNYSQLQKMGLTETPLIQELYLNFSGDPFILGSPLDCSAHVDREKVKSESCGIQQSSLNSSLSSKVTRRSKLHHLLNEQPTETRKLIERNKKLLGRTSSNITSTATSIPSSPNAHHQSMNQIHFSCIQNGCSKTNQNNQSFPLDTLEINPSRNQTHSSSQSFCSAPICIKDRFWVREKRNAVHNLDLCKIHVIPSTQLNYPTIQTEAENQECCQFQMKSISVLQNHISLLEQENSVFKRELSVSKQQEAQAHLLVRQLQLEIQELSSSKDSLITYNQQLLEQLQKTTAEANQMITNLTHLNQELKLKAKNYQSAADKLTLQLINLTKAADLNVRKPPNLVEDCINFSDLDFSSTISRNNNHLIHNSDSRIEPKLFSDKGNSKLQADLSFLNQRIDSLQNDNDKLLKENAAGKENLKCSINVSDKACNDNSSPMPRFLSSKIQRFDHSQRLTIEKSVQSRKRLDLNGSNCQNILH